MVLLLLLQCGCGGSSGKGGWQYTGKAFQEVFYGYPEDEGEVYVHNGYITIMQATKKGNLVERFERVIWVETPGKRYEDGQPLGDGYYVRRGSYEYETALGTEKTVARYVQVTDKKMLQEFEKVNQQLEVEQKAKEEAWEAERKAKEAAEEEARKAEKEAKQKAREEAAEQGAYELDIPIKSLCGFTLGVPPSQVGPMFQNDDGTPVQNFVAEVLEGRFAASGDGYEGYARTFPLAKPLRRFTHAKVTFESRGVGLHLAEVQLKMDITNISKNSYEDEAKIWAMTLEKGYGIKFTKGTEWGSPSYRWLGKDVSIHIYVLRYDGNFLVVEYGTHILGKLDAAAISKLTPAEITARREALKQTIVVDFDW